MLASCCRNYHCKATATLRVVVAAIIALRVTAISGQHVTSNLFSTGSEQSSPSFATFFLALPVALTGRCPRLAVLLIFAVLLVVILISVVALNAWGSIAAAPPAITTAVPVATTTLAAAPTVAVGTAASPSTAASAALAKTVPVSLIPVAPSSITPISIPVSTSVTVSISVRASRHAHTRTQVHESTSLSTKTAANLPVIAMFLLPIGAKCPRWWASRILGSVCAALLAHVVASKIVVLALVTHPIPRTEVHSHCWMCGLARNPSTKQRNAAAAAAAVA
mmetsp:Transcript_129329/g.251808  ORF Transcript_129329/g.251808 Transcript_129329/m.251808 type:complete len:279 (-) Transcript_129329:6-842(-)